jgi:hypothetical protein
MITQGNNGSVIVSDIINGYRVQRTYIGYTIREAKTLFKREVQ